MIFCIIVIYHPNFETLKKCIESILPQVEKVILVNNDIISLLNFSVPKIHIIQLGENKGIAYAQNKGIEYSLSQDADYVLFSDQDTVYPNDFIRKSLACYQRHKSEKIAAVVPWFYNENKKQYAKVSFSKVGTASPEKDKDNYLQHAISSGTFCHISAFNIIGMMNERFFIDWVEIEWCWRAVNIGYKIICDTTNIIHHDLGDAYKKVLGRKIVVYSDFRNYYFFRNATYLLLHSHLLNFKEQLSFASYILQKSILYFITKGISLKHLKTFFKAVIAGIINKF